MKQQASPGWYFPKSLTVSAFGFLISYSLRATINRPFQQMPLLMTSAPLTFHLRCTCPICRVGFEERHRMVIEDANICFSPSFVLTVTAGGQPTGKLRAAARSTGLAKPLCLKENAAEQSLQYQVLILISAPQHDPLISTLKPKASELLFKFELQLCTTSAKVSWG